jgi:hypothetical protein
LARRLITALLTVAMSVALATAAAAAMDDGEATPREVPESGFADRGKAAADRSEASIEAILDTFRRRLDRLATESAEPRTEALRTVAVQKGPTPPDLGETPTEPTEAGGEGESPPGTDTTETTPTLPAGPTTGSTTTTTTAPATEPPPSCDTPDDLAIQNAFTEFQTATADAWTETEKALADLDRRADADEAALEAALAAARTLADVERAYDDAVAAKNRHYDGLVAAFEELKASTVSAGDRTRASLIAACADEATVDALAADISSLLAAWDKVIQEQVQTARTTDLAALDAEKATFLKDFLKDLAPAGGGEPGAPRSGNGGNGDQGGGAGGGAPSGDDAGEDRLPFAGANALPLLIVGMVLVAAGVLTVIVTRRRRDRGESAG